MGRKSREKGKRGERELASALRDYGYNCRRGQQYCGDNGDADVVGLPGVHIECKRAEKLDLKRAIAQSINDAKDDEIPVVIHRESRKPWMVSMLYLQFKRVLLTSLKTHPSYFLLQDGIVSMYLGEWIELYRNYEAGRSQEGKI